MALIEIAGYDKKVSYPAWLTDSDPISAAPSGQKSLKAKTVQQVVHLILTGDDASFRGIHLRAIE